MPEHQYHGNAQTSPAKPEKPNTYDPTRQGLEDLRKADEVRDDMMEDCVYTTISMPPRQFQDYIPVPHDFDLVFPEERIETITSDFQALFRNVKTRDTLDEGEKVTRKARPLESSIGEILVCRNHPVHRSLLILSRSR